MNCDGADLCLQGRRAFVNWEDIKLRTLEKLQELLRLHPDVTCPLQCTPTASEITPLGYLSQSPFNFFALALLSKRLLS